MEREKRKGPGTEPWISPIWRIMGEEEEAAKKTEEAPPVMQVRIKGCTILEANWRKYNKKNDHLCQMLMMGQIRSPWEMTIGSSDVEIFGNSDKSRFSRRGRDRENAWSGYIWERMRSKKLETECMDNSFKAFYCKMEYK